jgi:hypothetical protein
VRILVEQFYLLFTSTLLVETSVLLLPRLHKFSKTLGLFTAIASLIRVKEHVSGPSVFQALWDGSVPDPPIQCSGYVRCCGRHSLAPGKMVRIHHGAATVSGERLCIDATVIDVSRHS